jgi:hypothetical protein
VLSLSLVCPFLIAPWFFSDAYLSCVFTNKRQRKPKDQSGMDNPKTMVALGTQDTGQISVRENRRTNQEFMLSIVLLENIF